MSSPTPRYGRVVAAAVPDSRWHKFGFPAAAVLSLLLALGLGLYPDLIQDQILPPSRDSFPLLKQGEMFELTSEAPIKPQLSGDFSLYEPDGIWLLQGDGSIDFELTEAARDASVTLALGALPTETRLEIASAGEAPSSIIMAGDSRVATRQLSRDRVQSIQISCEITGPPVDLGLDIRDLCVKLLWMKVD